MDKRILDEVVDKELEQPWEGKPEVMDKELWEGKAELQFPQLTEPTYWLSHEYKEIKQEIMKLNEKMDLILFLLPSRKRKCTISEVNDKMDNLIKYVKTSN